MTTPGNGVAFRGAGAAAGGGAGAAGAAAGADAEFVAGFSIAAATGGIVVSTNFGSPNLIPTRVSRFCAVMIGRPVKSGITNPSAGVSSSAAMSRSIPGRSIPGLRRWVLCQNRPKHGAGTSGSHPREMCSRTRLQTDAAQIQSSRSFLVPIRWEPQLSADPDFPKRARATRAAPQRPELAIGKGCVLRRRLPSRADANFQIQAEARGLAACLRTSCPSERGRVPQLREWQSAL